MNGDPFGMIGFALLLVAVFLWAIETPPTEINR